MAERPDDPLVRLRALDQAFARRGPSPRSRDAVRRKLQRRAVEQPFHARLRWWPALGFAAGAVTMALLSITKSTPTERSSAPLEASQHATVTEPVPLAPVPEHEPPAMASERACAPLEPGPLTLEANACAAGDGVRVSALLPSQLERHADVIELHAGELLFDVAPRPGRPLHVTLGEVDIEVVGTRFIVHDDDGQGSIAMLEGHVRLQIGEDPARDLRGGQRLEWPVPTPEPATPRARPTKPRASDEGLAALLAEVAELRRQGAYREAVERLRASDSRRFDARARQLISYEIGTLLERQLAATTEACAHWAEHRRRFPQGRHEAIVTRSMERLGCAPS